ncbi:hypothetical protein HNQ92_004708 [Rhabdobacter roseus]|uniref:Uncharacterized protein n=1 Tax=Rhabdobacter roseus TaxID=1655419 RepID=A0A840TYB1_9BACT|nr:hypothetical protein [Rhabdobacter roseus]
MKYPTVYPVVRNTHRYAVRQAQTVSVKIILSVNTG